MSESSRLESAIAALLPFRELIDGGAPLIVELHFHPDSNEIRSKVFQWSAGKSGR